MVIDTWCRLWSVWMAFESHAISVGYAWHRPAWWTVEFQPNSSLVSVTDLSGLEWMLLLAKLDFWIIRIARFEWQLWGASETLFWSRFVVVQILHLKVWKTKNRDLSKMKNSEMNSNGCAGMRRGCLASERKSMVGFYEEFSTSDSMTKSPTHSSFKNEQTGVVSGGWPLIREHLWAVLI